jgi:hypothetical protein
MSQKYNLLAFGASYGSLLGMKLLAAGHDVRLVCLPDEAALFNKDGARVRLPVRGREELVEMDSRNLSGTLSASGPADVNVGDYDMVILAMQEPQYRSPGVRELLNDVAKAKVPCMSIMNMPPLPFLARIPGIDVTTLTGCYTDASVWSSFDNDLMTLASPDPQAFRPPEEPTNVLQVSLPTNFKVAPFASDAHTKILRDLQEGIEHFRLEVDGESLALPVKLKSHDSVYVPLAKWCMLMTGNYRCVLADGMRSIKDSVHSDLEASRAVYEWVGELCRRLGAAPQDQVPFEKYANAANGLAKPSSAARALEGGAQNIERLDRVVKTLADQLGMQNDVVDATVATVDARLEANRRAAT